VGLLRIPLCLVTLLLSAGMLLYTLVYVHLRFKKKPREGENRIGGGSWRLRIPLGLVTLVLSADMLLYVIKCTKRAVRPSGSLVEKKNGTLLGWRRARL
jgi:hypothetical protein